MAITILSVTGVGGNPPTKFTIRGTVSGCETVDVTTSCSTKIVRATIPTGAPGTWTVDIPNDKQCACGSTVSVTAVCSLGAPSEARFTQTLTIDCGSCPQVTGSMSVPGDCDAVNARPVTLTVAFNPPTPAGATVSVTWIPGGPLPPTTTNPAGASASQTFAYPAGTYYPVAVVAITLASGQVCQATTINFGALTVSACQPCPGLTLTAAVQGCAPTNASVSLTASWPSGTTVPPGVTYYWTIDAPGATRRAQKSGPAASVNTTSGWTGTLATSSGAVDLSQPGNYSVSVHAAVPGQGPSCDPAASVVLPVPPCRCPAPTSGSGEWTATGITAPFGPNVFQTLSCDHATTTIALTVDPGGYQPADIRYAWDFGDGSPVVTGQGPAGASQSHTFTNPVPGQSHTFVVTVTVSVAGSTCAPFSRTASITVPGCATTACPSVSQLTPDRTTDCINPGGTVAFTFTGTVTNPGSVVGGFQWDFGDGTTQVTSGPTTSHSYSSTGTFTVRLTVHGPSGSSCPPSWQTTTVTVTRCTSNGGTPGVGMSAGCWVLLLAALVLAIVASVLGIVAACSGNVYLGIAAGAVGLVALVLLVLWLVFCAAGNCGLFNWARWIVIWILMAAVVVGVLVGIFGSVACGVMATFILWGYWGTILAILDIAGPKIPCTLTAPPWP